MMSTHPRSGSDSGAARRGAERGRRAAGDDGGFILLETMIALSLITVIMAAVSVQYVGGMLVSAQQRSMTAASQIATSAMSDLRGTDPTDLLAGRTKVDVVAQGTKLAKIAKVANWVTLTDNRLVYNNAPDTAPIKTTTVPVTTPSKRFGVDTYLACSTTSTLVTNADGTEQRSCASTSSQSQLIALVVITWSDRGCPSVDLGDGNGNRPTCAFVTSTLVDTHDNPTFDLNQSLPPAPVAKAVPDQVRAVGDIVSLTLTVEDGKGAAPFTWALTSGALPKGLSLAPSGAITGTLEAATEATTAFTVTDAFLRTSQVSVKWSVTQPLVLTKPANQASVTGSAITPVQLTSTGGSGTYVYADPGGSLPPGITMTTAGRITGTPTQDGDYTVTLRVTDSAGRVATTTVQWGVSAPLVLTNPGDQVATVNRPEEIPLTASGGSRTYTFSASPLPAGMTVDNTRRVITGTPTATTTASGITVTVTVNDGKNPAQTKQFNLKVVAAPTIAKPANQATTSGGTATPFTVASTCNNAPCSYRIDNGPAGVSISSSGGVSGTVTSGRQVFSNVTVTVTDSAGATATTPSFTWTVNGAPSLGTMADRTTGRSTGVDLNGPSASGGTGSLTWSATGLPSGVAINSSTGRLTGTTANANSAQTTTITVVDASNVRSSTSFRWYVSNLLLDVPNSTLPRQYIRVNLADFASGGSGGYSYSSSTLPPGLSINGSFVEGTPSRSDTYTTTIRITDSSGAFFDDVITVRVQ